MISRRLPPIPAAAPRWGSLVTRTLGRAALRALRWRVAGEIPDVPKLVAVAAPHTCTLDVLVGLAVLLSLGVRVRWLGKHTIFREPLGRVLRWLGGIPVDRRAPSGIVGQVVDLVNRTDRFYLALSPEGTRRKVDHWKTGFYRVAVACQLPIIPVALDYRRRVADIGRPLLPTGDYSRDLDVLRRHFTPDMARHPERYSP